MAPLRHIGMRKVVILDERTHPSGACLEGHLPTAEHNVRPESTACVRSQTLTSTSSGATHPRGEARIGHTTIIFFQASA